MSRFAFLFSYRTGCYRHFCSLYDLTVHLHQGIGHGEANDINCLGAVDGRLFCGEQIK